MKTKKKIIAIVSGLALVFVAVVAVVFATRQNNVEIQAPDATKDSSVVETAHAAENKASEANDNTSEEVSDEATEEKTQEATTKQTEEASAETTKKKATSTKKENATKKAETTTKAVETTTKKSSSTTVTFNGHKPYEVFADETGTEYYYTESGRLCCAESLTAKPDTNYDASYCHTCGSKDCIRAMSSYYCVTCEKDIPSLTCHPKSHYNASH